MNNCVQVFDFNGAAIRTVEKDNDVWFVADDVCHVLGISEMNIAVQSLDFDEVRIQVLMLSGRHQDITTISEAGLFALIFKSLYPEAKDFSRWVTHQVLPQIRKASKTERFTRSIMSAARMIFSAAGLNGSQLALALDKVALHYTGESMLGLSGIELELPEDDDNS